MRIATILLTPWRQLPELYRATMDAFDAVLFPGKWKPLLLLVSLLVVWHVYVPIHELIHAGVCLATGGSVDSLALKPRYGGYILQKVFPFIEPESDYAGQLTGFSPANIWAYFLIVFSPYLLSLFGLTAIKNAKRTASPIWFSIGAVLLIAPWTAIPGDYYEGVSLVTTRIAAMIDPGLPADILISDDVFRLISQLMEEGMMSFGVSVFVLVGIVLSAYLTMVTMALQVVLFSRESCRN